MLIAILVDEDPKVRVWLTDEAKLRVYCACYWLWLQINRSKENVMDVRNLSGKSLDNRN